MLCRFTSVRPEPVIFVRAIKLANVTYSRLMGKLEKLNEVSYVSVDESNIES